MIKKIHLSEYINQNIKTTRSLIKQESKINECIQLIYKKLTKGGKLLLCGNGGSAADAQHLTAEFLIRLRPKINRHPIPAMALATDTSTITACGNDYNFDQIFSRPFEALSKKNDVLITISTSGNSKNIINVLKAAKRKKISTIGFLGCKGGSAKKYCDISLVVESSVTARIQESHIFLGHYIFENVEKLILKA